MNKKLVSILLIFGVLGFLSWKVLDDWETITSFKWEFSLFDIALFLVFLPLPFLMDAIAWHLVTQAQGERISFFKNFEIWMISNFARYLPGGVWQYPGRILLLSKLGVSKTSAITCLVLESLFVSFTGLLLIFLMFISGSLNLSFESIRFLVLVGLSLTILFFLISSKKFMTKASRLFVSLTGKDWEIKNVSIPFSKIPILVFAYFLVFLFPSVMLFIIAKAVTPISLSILPVLVGAYAASWLVGYVTFFAPAGIGVREVSLAGFLSLYMPFSVAAVLVIALRIALLASEAVGFGLAVLISKKRI